VAPAGTQSLRRASSSRQQQRDDLTGSRCAGCRDLGVNTYDCEKPDYNIWKNHSRTNEALGALN